ncbi:peptidoglycan DD-metalloendopeptidase family protein [Methylobacterium radiodurans]|uniref:Peptidase M23 n=1 Tax=Methylobacterium radiodurans TaxID=2202828 RepID=A0A2U8VWN1_9HYPH|nr:peptidoglycan DD-metalloendopeptidase family protein [Methylobacterium radiodurans]AWN38199.1 peptidase M23 [Methylobacterium radiodurans]
MRVRVAGRGMRTLSRVALIGIIGGGAAACSSDTMRLGDPFTNPFASNRTSEPSATGSLPDNDLAPAPAIRTGRIQSEALGAPSAPITPRALPAPTPVAMKPAAAAPATRVASTGAAGWSASGGTTITVSQNDSLNQMSTRFGVPASAILSANGLTSASQVTPGRQIVIPVYNASGMNPAATPAMSARAVPAAPAERLKAAEAKRQDEQKRVAETKREAAAREAAAKAEASREAAKEASKKLAEAKAAKEAAQKAAALEAEKKKHVRPGQTAKVEPKDAKADPKAEAARKAEAEAKLAKAEAAKEAAKKLAEAKSAKDAAKDAAKAAADKAAAEKLAADKAAAAEKKVAAKPAEKAEPASTGSVAQAPAAPAGPDQNFRWPAKGRVISGYGTSGNEGINIAVPEGTAVKAAEDGTVAYAGSDVKGYGKLVLVRHQNGYVSAYAHNGELDVKPGEKVKRGQTIAKSGASGNVTSPQLHFEIRKGGAPIDPMTHLASN